MTSSKGRPEEVEQAIALQQRANAIVMAALTDDDFMKGVLEAREQEARGEKGELLTDVIKRLGLV